jgi:hypothetical protein
MEMIETSIAKMDRRNLKVGRREKRYSSKIF